MRSESSTTGLRDRLVDLRQRPNTWLRAIGLGILVGALLGSVHWVGLFVGGAVAGLGQRTILRGIGAGALAGLGVWLVFLATLRLDAALIPALGSMPILAVSLGIAVAYGAFGGLLRGVF